MKQNYESLLQRLRTITGPKVFPSSLFCIVNIYPPCYPRAVKRPLHLTFQKRNKSNEQCSPNTRRSLKTNRRTCDVIHEITIIYVLFIKHELCN